jgi:ATP-dependent DNA helicase RecG
LRPEESEEATTAGPLSVEPEPLSVKAAQPWIPPDLPKELSAALKRLKARVAQPEMEDLVWRLCAWKSLSAGELARCLARSRNHVTNRLLTPMLRAGRLEMTMPSRPKHPQQTYRATAMPNEGEQP